MRSLAAVFTASRRAPGIFPRILELHGRTEHAAVRVAVLEALVAKLLRTPSEEDVRLLTKFVTPRVHERLVAIERERDANSGPEAHYTRLLTEAIHAGNHAVAAAACLPLGRGRGGEYLRALEIATGSDDDTVALCATWALSLRDPDRPRPALEGADDE